MGVYINLTAKMRGRSKMKIKDCKINMMVKANKDISNNVRKGDKVKIIYMQEYPPFIDIDNGEFIVPERSPKHFDKIKEEN